LILGTTLPNSGVVVEGRIYRGSQPTDAQIGELRAIGVSTIIDLREPWGRGVERLTCFGYEITYWNIPIGETLVSLGIEPPTAEQLSRIFALLDGPGVFYVHCHNGADRTGDVIFAYRMHTGWTREAAIAEAAQYQDTAQKPLDREWMEHYTPA
jgi:protein tyrosine/serine phosphatase